MTRCIKVLGQRDVVIYKDVVSATTVDITVKAGVAQTEGATISLTEEEIVSLISNGYVQISISRMVPSGLVDTFYSLDILVDSVLDNTAGFGYTATATSKLYAKVSQVDPRTPEFHIPKVLHSAKMLLDEMNALEDVNVAQRTYQFDKRLAILKDILGYD
jgi:hypothetical protein